MPPRNRPLGTHGLTHIALGVVDIERAFAFYEEVFGMVAVFRAADFIQAQTPGARDVIVFQHAAKLAGKSGGIAHFGFRLKTPGDIEVAAERVRHAGGTVTDAGDFAPGEPYLFARDPDGYLIEIWYELPTSADPR